MEKEKKRILAIFRNSFLAGVAVLLPMVGTILIVTFLVRKVNAVLLEPILHIFVPVRPWADIHLIEAAVKLAILIVILLAIAGLGILVKNYFIRRLFGLGEGIVMRVPLVNSVYRVIQQLSDTFLNKKNEMYNKVVLVEYPRKDCFVLGLMTTSCRGEIATKLGDDFVNVFVPTTPNPTSGFLIMLRRNQVKELEISTEDAMKVIVSSGIVTPDSKKLSKTP